MPLDYRILVITANVLANQLCLPVPVIPTLIVAGALVAQGELSPTTLFLCVLLACVVADSVWYLAGRMYGSNVMKLLCRISLTPDSCVSDTQSRFERWGFGHLPVCIAKIEQPFTYTYGDPAKTFMAATRNLPNPAKIIQVK